MSAIVNDKASDSLSINYSFFFKRPIKRGNADIRQISDK
jgi:hypothetical protein